MQKTHSDRNTLLTISVLNDGSVPNKKAASPKADRLIRIYRTRLLYAAGYEFVFNTHVALTKPGTWAGTA